MGREVLPPLHRTTEMGAGTPIQAEAAIRVEVVVAVQAEAAIRAEVAAVIQGGAGATVIQRGAGSPSRVPRLAPAEFRVNWEALDPLRMSLADNLIQQLPSQG